MTCYVMLCGVNCKAIVALLKVQLQFSWSVSREIVIVIMMMKIVLIVTIIIIIILPLIS